MRIVHQQRERPLCREAADRDRQRDRDRRDLARRKRRAVVLAIALEHELGRRGTAGDHGRAVLRPDPVEQLIDEIREERPQPRSRSSSLPTVRASLKPASRASRAPTPSRLVLPRPALPTIEMT